MSDVVRTADRTSSPKGFVHLKRRKRKDGNIVYCARCGTAQTPMQVRLNKINDGQYSLCCDDNLASKRPINCLEPKR